VELGGFVRQQIDAGRDVENPIERIPSDELTEMRFCSMRSALSTSSVTMSG
jgi:hypothetical protein